MKVVAPVCVCVRASPLCVFVCVYMCVCVCVCECVRDRPRITPSVCVRVCVRARPARACVGVCVRTCVCADMCLCVHERGTAGATYKRPLGTAPVASLAMSHVASARTAQRTCNAPPAQRRLFTQQVYAASVCVCILCRVGTRRTHGVSPSCVLRHLRLQLGTHCGAPRALAP